MKVSALLLLTALAATCITQICPQDPKIDNPHQLRAPLQGTDRRTLGLLQHQYYQLYDLTSVILCWPEQQIENRIQGRGQQLAVAQLALYGGYQL